MYPAESEGISAILVYSANKRLPTTWPSRFVLHTKEIAPNWNNIVQCQYWFSGTFWRNLQLFLYECCSMWKLFSIFVLSRKRQTYRKCFRTVLQENVEVFNVVGHEQHSFLVSIWQGVFSYTCIPYLSSVGYCVVYYYRVIPQPSWDKRNQSHTFFFD